LTLVLCLEILIHLSNATMGLLIISWTPFVYYSVTSIMLTFAPLLGLYFIALYGESRKFGGLQDHQIASAYFALSMYVVFLLVFYQLNTIATCVGEHGAGVLSQCYSN
jgi:hypothetical protein